MNVTLYSISWGICLVLGGYLALVLLIALHELGHWLAAVACGFCRIEVRFSVIRWRRKKGWDLAWISGYLLDGITNVHITRADHWLRLRYLFFAACGPAASFVVGFGLIGLSGRLHGFAADVTAMLGAGSALLGISSLVPRKFKSRRSDGLRMIDALFNLKDMDRIRFGARLHDDSAVLKSLYENKAWDELLSKASGYLEEARRWNLNERAVKGLEDMVLVSRAGLVVTAPESTIATF